MTDEARALVLAISERCPVRTGGTCYCKHRKAMVRVQSALDAARGEALEDAWRAVAAVDTPLCYNDDTINFAGGKKGTS